MKPFPASFALALLSAGALTAGSPTARAATSKPRSWVALSAKTNATKYVTGAPISITITARNTSSRDAFLRFSSGQRFDVQLFKPSAKTPVYTWSASKMFPESVGQLRLKAGQSASFSAQIGQEQGALVPGKYQLRAHLTNSSNIAIEAPPVSIEVVPAPMQLQVSTTQTRLKIGEPVSFSLKAINTSKKTQDLGFSSAQRFDVSIADATGKQVWSWAAGKRFAESLGKLSLAPGESKTFEATWDGQALPGQKITPGSYTVQATLTSNPPINAAPLSIEIK